MLSIGQARPEKLRRGDRLAAILWAVCAQLFSLLGPHFTFWLFRRATGRLFAKSTNVEVIRRNVHIAYADLVESEREGIVRGVVSNLPLAMAELMLQPYWRRNSVALTRHNLDAEWLQPFAQNEKKAVFLIGHFSGWEANLITLSKFLKNTVAVYAPPKNPLLEKFFREGRTDLSGNWVLYPRDHRLVQRKLAKRFLEGRSLLYALDAPLPGPMLPFMGHTSPTALRPYQLAAEATAPIIPLNCGRDRDGVGFWIEALEPMYAVSTSYEDVIDLATRMNNHYTNWIRANPEHWYWTGRFFRSNKRYEAKQKLRNNSSFI